MAIKNIRGKSALKAVYNHFMNQIPLLVEELGNPTLNKEEKDLIESIMEDKPVEYYCVVRNLVKASSATDKEYLKRNASSVVISVGSGTNATFTTPKVERTWLTPEYPSMCCSYQETEEQTDNGFITHCYASSWK